jgi:hypothetical protein
MANDGDDAAPAPLPGRELSASAPHDNTEAHHALAKPFGDASAVERKVSTAALFDRQMDVQLILSSFDVLRTGTTTQGLVTKNLNFLSQTATVAKRSCPGFAPTKKKSTRNYAMRMAFVETVLLLLEAVQWTFPAIPRPSPHILLLKLMLTLPLSAAAQSRDRFLQSFNEFIGKYRRYLSATMS